MEFIKSYMSSSWQEAILKTREYIGRVSLTKYALQ